MKTSYDFEPKVKNRLRKLKYDLQVRGFSGVTETSIIAALIESAKVADLEAHFSRRERD
ncbi:MAG: hypothetical protein ACYDCA_06615 [Candidatus Tyrphobacter sp.]